MKTTQLSATTTQPHTTATRPDWLLAGRYRMEEVIGRGGMSTVYRASDRVLERTVAVKILLSALAENDPIHVARFQREARAVAALRHPAVVRVYDSGADGESHFIVMEHVAGRGLDELLRGGQRLPPPEAARIGAAVAGALAAAHAAGILHRDVKPANVMITPDGAVKVLDFGIARAREDATLTQTAVAIGTASYMAPERILGQAGDERSDIYALGCLLYAMLAGRPPFLGPETVAILHQQVHDEAPALQALVPEQIPPGLAAIVVEMLAKDPGDRPQSATRVAGLLAPHTDASGQALPPRLPREPPTAPTHVARTRVLGAAPVLAGPRRRLRPWGLGALAALALVGLALGSAGSTPRPGPGARSARTSGVGQAPRRTAHRRRTGVPSARAVPSNAPPASAGGGPAPPKPAPRGGPKPGPRGGPKPVPPGHGGVPPGQAKHGHGHDAPPGPPGP